MHTYLLGVNAHCIGKLHLFIVGKPASTVYAVRWGANFNEQVRNVFEK